MVVREIQSDRMHRISEETIPAQFVVGSIEQALSSSDTSRVLSPYWSWIRTRSLSASGEVPLAFRAVRVAER